jgi:hypothetical protein
VNSTIFDDEVKFPLVEKAQYKLVPIQTQLRSKEGIKVNDVRAHLPAQNLTPTQLQICMQTTPTRENNATQTIGKQSEKHHFVRAMAESPKDSITDSFLSLASARYADLLDDGLMTFRNAGLKWAPSTMIFEEPHGVSVISALETWVGLQLRSKEKEVCRILQQMKTLNRGVEIKRVGKLPSKKAAVYDNKRKTKLVCIFKAQ